MIRLLISLLFVLSLLSGPVGASDVPQAEIRFEAQRQDGNWVGQELELYLELWSDGFSFGKQLWVLPEVRGGYLFQADSSTVKLTERRGDEQWQGLRYTFLFYPQREGRLEVPAFDVSFQVSTGYGKEPAALNFRTQNLLLDTSLPLGANRGGLLVSSSSFEMEASWRPAQAGKDALNLTVGDALTLEVKRRAQDVPGMVFAPLPDFRIEGLGVYPDTPQVNDRINRGSLTGTRTDVVTFICEREGKFEIPAMRFQWWNPATEVLSEQVIPALEFEVVANPAYAAGAAQTKGAIDGLLSWKALAAALLAVFLILYPGRWLAGVIADRWQRWRREQEAGEPWAFRQLLSACRSGSAMQAYNAVSVWLGHYEEGKSATGLLQLAQARGDASLAREAAVLQARVVAGSTAEWNGGKLAARLKKLRENKVQTASAANGLNPLNPGPATEESTPAAPSG